MIDMLRSQLTNNDDDAHSFMTWLSLVYLTMIPQVLVYVPLRFRPNAAATEQMDSSWKLAGAHWNIGVILAANGTYKLNFLMIQAIILMYELLKDIVEIYKQYSQVRVPWSSRLCSAIWSKNAAPGQLGAHDAVSIGILTISTPCEFLSQPLKFPPVLDY